ncbi:MAG: lmo0937 family membrane protein [Gelidibacter sp.]
MKTLFYTISVLVVIVWALSFFVYGLNESIHFLLLTSVLLGVAGLFEKH